jgi:transcription elongation GreA/GreB family factor
VRRERKASAIARRGLERWEKNLAACEGDRRQPAGPTLTADAAENIREKAVHVAPKYCECCPRSRSCGLSLWHDAGVRERKDVKRALVAALLAKLEEELATMRRAAKDAREAATHEEAKPENDKDTRALEASYLAGAQAARVRDIEGAIKTIGAMPLLDLDGGKPIQSSAVVTLEDENEERTAFFLAPFGGGIVLTVDTLSVQVLTPQSPRGQALLGRLQGDVIEVRGKPGSARELTIVEVW